jgi:hypothetical protein
MLRVQTRHCCSSEGSRSTPLDCYPLSTGWCATLSWDNYVWNFGVEILHPIFFGGGNHRFGLVNSNDIRSKKTTIKLVWIIISNKVENEQIHHQLVQSSKVGIMVFWLQKGNTWEHFFFTSMYCYVLVKSCQHPLSLVLSWSTCMFGCFQF